MVVSKKNHKIVLFQLTLVCIYPLLTGFTHPIDQLSQIGVYLSFAAHSLCCSVYLVAAVQMYCYDKKVSYWSK